MDAIDELPIERRSRFLTLFGEVVRMFPHIRYVVTSRPSALKEEIWPDWMSFLSLHKFDTVAVADLDEAQRNQLIVQWHEAAAAYSVRQQFSDPLKYREMGQSLQALLSVQSREPLRRLAASPLLCAMLCYLHVLKGEELPAKRVKLYEICIEVMMSGRDVRRDLRLVGSLPIDVDIRLELLTNLAWWAVRQTTTSALLDRQSVVAQLAERLGVLVHLHFSKQNLSRAVTQRLNVSQEMKSERILKDSQSLREYLSEMRKSRFSDIASLVVLAERVLKFTIERAGLIRDPVVDKVTFVHRTLQEYLAAKEAVESGYYDELVQHARDEQWREMIVLAAGIAPRIQSNLFLQKILSGQRFASNRHRVFLAIACLETASAVDSYPVLEEVRRFLPPVNFTEAQEVAKAGDPIVTLLANRDKLTETEAEYSVQALLSIGSREAIRTLATYQHDTRHSIRRQLANGLASTLEPQYYAKHVLGELTELAIDLKGFPSLAPLMFLTQVQTLILDNANRRIADLIILTNLPTLQKIALTGMSASDPEVRDLVQACQGIEIWTRQES